MSVAIRKNLLLIYLKNLIKWLVINTNYASDDFMKFIEIMGTFHVIE